MIRLLHTADTHLDACFAKSALPPPAAAQCRERRFEALAGALREAASWPADAVLIAGDLFVAKRTARATIAAVRELFAEMAPVPVFIAPGNRDPYVPESPYATEEWPENVHIFKAPAWRAVALPDSPLTVHGVAVADASQPLPKLSFKEDGRMHIAVAHGAERAHQPPEGMPFALFDWRDLDVPALPYLALGHFHRATRIEGPQHTCMAYPGTPEPLGFLRPESGSSLEVEIDENSGAVTLRELAGAGTAFIEDALPCDAYNTTDEVLAALRACLPGGGKMHFGRITLTGDTGLPIAAELASLEEAAAEGWAFLELADATGNAEKYDAIAHETTSLGAFAAESLRHVAAAPDAATRRMLTRALELGLGAFHGALPPVRGGIEDAG